MAVEEDLKPVTRDRNVRLAGRAPPFENTVSRRQDVLLGDKRAAAEKIAIAVQLGDPRPFGLLSRLAADDRKRTDDAKNEDEDRRQHSDPPPARLDQGNHSTHMSVDAGGRRPTSNVGPGPGSVNGIRRH